MRRIVFALLFAALSGSVVASEESCMSATRAGLLAVSAQSWDEIIKTADLKIKECGKRDRAELASTLSHKVMAYAKTGQHKRALAEAQKCIKTYYATPDCHYWKAVVYRDTKKEREFENAKADGVAVCNAILKNSRLLIETTSNSAERVDMQTYTQVAEIVLKKFKELEY